MGLRYFTLEYWVDEGWYIGRLKEVPGVFSQGETLEELEDNIRDAYKLVTGENLNSLDEISAVKLSDAISRVLEILTLQ